MGSIRCPSYVYLWQLSTKITSKGQLQPHLVHSYVEFQMLLDSLSALVNFAWCTSSLPFGFYLKSPHTLHTTIQNLLWCLGVHTQSFMLLLLWVGCAYTSFPLCLSWTLTFSSRMQGGGMIQDHIHSIASIACEQAFPWQQEILWHKKLRSLTACIKIGGGPFPFQSEDYFFCVAQPRNSPLLCCPWLLMAFGTFQKKQDLPLSIILFCLNICLLRKTKLYSMAESGDS